MDGFLRLMKNKKMPKHALVDRAIWKGNWDKQFFWLFLYVVCFVCL
jgi:hypothetical protein